MGRPKELTEAERKKLIAEGYRRVEVWLPDLESDALWEAVLQECKQIREAEEDTEANLFVEEGLRETLRLIEARENGRE